MISSSGGHFEQLKMLSPLADNHSLFWVTEKTAYASEADYHLIATGMKDWLVFLKMLFNTFKSFLIWIREKPDVVITTGTLIVIPMCLIAKLFGKKFIYIESFAKVYDGNRTSKLLYRFADLFIYQWESLKEVYPKGVYGGSIY